MEIIEQVAAVMAKHGAPVVSGESVTLEFARVEDAASARRAVLREIVAAGCGSVKSVRKGKATLLRRGYWLFTNSGFVTTGWAFGFRVAA